MRRAGGLCRDQTIVHVRGERDERVDRRVQPRIGGRSPDPAVHRLLSDSPSPPADGLVRIVAEPSQRVRRETMIFAGGHANERVCVQA